MYLQKTGFGFNSFLQEILIISASGKIIAQCEMFMESLLFFQGKMNSVLYSQNTWYNIWNAVKSGHLSTQ